MTVQELQGSEIRFTMDIDHPYARPIVEAANAHARDVTAPLPIDGLSMTVLTTFQAEGVNAGLTLAFGLMDTLWERDSLVSIWKPTPITHHDGIEYIIQDNSKVWINEC